MSGRRLFVSLALALAAAALVSCGEVETFADAATDSQPLPIDGPDPDAPDVPGTVTVTLVRGGGGTGSIISTPAGIDCGATCTFAFEEGTVLTLSATPAAGSVFSGWGGACSGTISNCSLTLSADVAINGDFAVATYDVTVVAGGNGTGAVTSTPAGINCPGTCTTTVAHGAMLTLAAAPGAGSTFLGWSGGGCTGTGGCNLTVTGPLTINAPFALNNSLVVNHAGNGTGGVTSSPAGINCGGDCSEAYSPGTMVTLTATAGAGSSFGGWSGACTGTGTCAVTMNMSQSVTATFTLDTYVLTVAKAGNGAGTVTSNPAGITCGADCNETVNHGAMAMLTATPAAGSTFTGWSGGGCTGTGTCAVTVTEATTVTARFTLNQYTLTVARAGIGSGTVTSSPAGINCGADCSEVLNHGTMITLTAAVVAGSGSSFAGWSGGGCTGTVPCVVTLTATGTVTATFNLTGPGGALDLDGTNDIATLAASTMFASTSMTVEAWIFPEAMTGAAVSIWGPGGSPDRFMMRITPAPTGAPQCTALISVPTQQSTAGGVTLNAWNHIAITYNGTQLLLYRNGVQTGTLAITGTLGTASGVPLRLGVEEIFLGQATFFNGRIDEVRVWNVARTAAQISANFNKLIAPTATGLVAYYRFDEVTGQTVLDATANGLGGVLGAASTVASDDPARIASTAPVTP